MTPATDWHALPLVDRAVLRADAAVVAPRLLGMVLVAGAVVARIVEVEAYDQDDPASHTHRGRTPRNATMFGDAGHLYVYRSYGVHHCGNVVAGEQGTGAGCLVRAVEVLDGRGVAAERRGGRDATPRDLGGGPGRVGQVLDLGSDTHDGLDLLEETAPVTLRSDGFAPGEVATGPRVGVTDAPDVPWRFWIAGHPAVSRYTRSPRAAPAVTDTDRRSGPAGRPGR